MKHGHVSVAQMDEDVERVHNTDEVKGSDEYGYTAKIFEEAYCDLKIEVDLPLQMPTLVLRNRSEGSMLAVISARAYLTTNVASNRKLFKILQPCFGQ